MRPTFERTHAGGTPHAPGHPLGRTREGIGDDGDVAADKKRGTQTVRDMVLSLIVITLAAGVIYLFIPHEEDDDPVRTVSYEVELNTARRAAPYPVAAPEGLSKQWRATSVSYEADEAGKIAWHLGFLDPDQEYVAVEQSDGQVGPFVEKVTRGAAETGKSVRINGDEWARYEGAKYDALVRTEAGSTTVVTGTAPWGQLRKMAGALEAEKTSPSPAPSASGATAEPSAGQEV